MSENKIVEGDLTYRIRACAFAVSNELGPGFLEHVYESALAIELQDAGLAVRTQCPIQVYYKGQIVGDYIADMIIEERVLIELKAVKALLAEHEAQILNYLRATRIKVGLLINFGQPRLEIKRFVL